MKKIIYLICLSIVTSHMQLLAYDVKHENSLLQRLNVAPTDSTKLTILYELVNITTDEQERNTHYINLLLEEADKQSNVYYKCQAYRSHIVNAFNMYDVEAVQKWNSLLEPIARRAKFYSLMFEGKRAAVDILNVSKQYVLAEKEAQKMLKEAIALKSDIGIAYAYQSLGYTNGFSYNIDQAAEYFEKSYEIFNKINKIESVNEVCDRLISIYTILEKYPERLRVIQKQEEIILQRAKDKSSSLREDFLINSLNYLNYYLDVSNLKEADKYFKLASQYYVKGYAAYDEVYRTTRIAYFQEKEEPAQAVAEIDTLLMITSDASTRNFWELKKAQILKNTGDYSEALALYKKTWPIKDSLKIDLLNKQTNQLMKDYNADALLLKNQQTRNLAQFSFIVLIVLIILILIWFMIHTYRAQSTLSKAEKEQIKLNRDMELANIAKEKFIANISSSIRKPLSTMRKDSLILASYHKLDIEERRLIAESISTTSNQLIKLINFILDLSHFEAKLVKYNINDIEITSTLRGIISEQGGVSAQIEDGKLIWSKVDNGRLIQVIKSIIETPRSTTPISIHTELIDKERVNIVIKESLLAVSDPSQDIIINNEINGMIIADFGGTYQVSSSTRSICISLPVALVQKM